MYRRVKAAAIVRYQQYQLSTSQLEHDSDARGCSVFQCIVERLPRDQEERLFRG
jgi:hypothetical protein